MKPKEKKILKRKKIHHNLKKIYKHKKMHHTKNKYCSPGNSPKVLGKHGKKRKSYSTNNPPFLKQTSDNESDSEDFDFCVASSKSKMPAIVYNCDSSSEEEIETIELANNTSDSDSSVQEIDNSVPNEVEELIITGEDEQTAATEESDGEGVPNILTFTSSKSSCFIFAAEHPLTFKITGAVTIKVISGSINILGYDLDASKEFVQVYSVPQICDLCIETTSCQVKSTSHCREIVTNFSELLDQNTCENVITTIKDPHVLILMIPKFDKCGAHFANSYYPGALCVPPYAGHNLITAHGFNIAEDDASTIKFNNFHSDVLDAVKQQIFNFSSANGLPPRIFIYGRKNLGKSIMVRYLVNKLLSGGVQRVFVLDADPGQSEFTVAGCVSLTRVTTPLLGPSYTHLQTPVKWKFVGVIALDASAKYFNHLNEVMEFFLKNFPNEILIINTAGWVTGYGKLALDSIKQVLKPTIEVDLVHRDVYSHAVKRMNTMFEEGSYPRKIVVPTRSFDSIHDGRKFLPSDLRNIALLSYFGKLHRYWETEMCTFNAFEPYCISATDLAIHIMNSNENDDEMKIRIVNGSIVALCAVDPSEIWHCADNSVPKRLKRASNFGECIGIGFVRAIDIEQMLLYIVTPVPFAQVQSVNALIKGKLDRLEVLFKKQKIPDVVLPYVAVSPGSKSLGVVGNKIKRRRFQPPNN